MATDTEKMVVTVKEYLTGAVGNITVSDSTLKMCLYKADALTYETDIDDGEGHVSRETVNTSFDTDISLLSEKQSDLSLAWLYATVAGYTAQSGTILDKSADWEHSEGSFRITDKLRELYKASADELFEKWGEPTLFSDKWGLVGHGIRNKRKYV